MTTKMVSSAQTQEAMAQLHQAIALFFIRAERVDLGYTPKAIELSNSLVKIEDLIREIFDEELEFNYVRSRQ